jgi:hypothetical protein
MAPGQSSKPRKKWITSKFLYNSFKSNEAYISVLVFKDATGSTHTHTGGEVRGRGIHGGTGAHLYREVEVWYEVIAYVTARGYTCCCLS